MIQYFYTIKCIYFNYQKYNSKRGDNILGAVTPPNDVEIIEGKSIAQTELKSNKDIKMRDNFTLVLLLIM